MEINVLKNVKMDIMEMDSQIHQNQHALRVTQLVLLAMEEK